MELVSRKAPLARIALGARPLEPRRVWALMGDLAVTMEAVVVIVKTMGRLVGASRFPNLMCFYVLC
jgi:hypothetical protein